MYTYRVRIRPASRGAGDLPGLFDMLRYDQSRVQTWDHMQAHDDGRAEHFVLTLKSERQPVIDRWASFGLIVTDVTEVR
jgi:hypothetical protein